MKDIFKKPAKPLDLSDADSQVYSPYTLDLSPQQKKSVPKQLDFYEYMPAALDAKSHPDDEFGEKLQYWYESAAAYLRGVYDRTAMQVGGALKPLRLYWAVMIGVGLILGLLIISYIATHRNWITSFPTGTQSKTAGSVQSDKPASAGSTAPGKGSAGSLQTATPAANAGTAGKGAGSSLTGAGGGGSSLPAVGSVPSGSTGGNTYYAPTSNSTSNAIVQPAPVPAPAPAPVTAPLPVATPAPTAAPTAAPLLPAPVDGVLSPVKSLL